MASQTVNGGETNRTNTQQPMQTVVVVQTPANDAINRYPRWAYLIFSIGFFAYHFVYGWFWLGLAVAAGDSASQDLQGYGALFFFCGALPSLIFWIWMITDSTVFCANGDRTNDPVTQICCCQCANGWFMMIPVALGALLRFILWCAFFGIVTDVLVDVDAGFAVDNFFWLFLSLVALDCGPAIYLSIDWYFYYGKEDYDGVLGTKQNPIRAIVAQMSVIFIISWAFIAVFEDIAEDAAPYIWPWIMYGLVSTACLVFAAFLWFSGSIKGNVVSNPVFRIICFVLGAAVAVMDLIIWGYFVSWMLDIDGEGSGWLIILILMYGTYFTSITVPAIWALFSFQVGETANQNNNNQAV
mmetsp:Transcript_70643/g.63441  ORF Transcript_70643/g.63441 Transcript_70643/m.63441 type:complete len:355 (-) Transcript_70643:221-1285(-)